jgi:hypothetical protein
MRNRRRNNSVPASRSNLGTIPDPIRSTDRARLNEGLAWLFGELREGHNLFRIGTDGGREGAVVEIKAITAFLMLFRAVDKENLIAPLAMLANALMALNSNVVEPMLRPVPRSGRPPASAGRQSLQGVAVYTVRRLQEFGVDDKSSRSIVAKELRMLGIKPHRGSGNTTARTIREWREAILADVGHHSDAAKTLDGLLTDTDNKKLDKLPREKAIEGLLNKLAHVAKQVRAGELI